MEDSCEHSPPGFNEEVEELVKKYSSQEGSKADKKLAMHVVANAGVHKHHGRHRWTDATNAVNATLKTQYTSLQVKNAYYNYHNRHKNFQHREEKTPK